MIVALISVLLFAALIFIFIPILPPGLFVFSAYLIYAHHTDYNVFNSLVLIVVAFLSILSLFVDNVLSFLGAKVFKASRLSMIGMMIGMVLGFIFGGPMGILIGILIGSFVGEFVNSALINKSIIVAVGALFGYFAGVLLKFFIIGGLIFYFLLKVLILKS
ncbi:MAG: DUF456 domain-containing protein [Deltaproteobacteria bacterium]|nr:DUF456 domain-containing protein [Deltaproteobacteria bacterium]